MFFILNILLWIAASYLTALVAKAMGAENPSTLRVMGSNILSFIALIVVMIPVALLLPPHPLLYLVVLGGVYVLVYAKMLGMPMLGGFLVTIANWLITLLLSLVLWGLGLIGFVDIPELDQMKEMMRIGRHEEATIASVERTAEDICACGLDEDCLLEQMIRFTVVASQYQQESPDPQELSRAQKYMERAESCLNNPQPYRPRALTEAENQPRRRRASDVVVEAPELFPSAPPAERPVAPIKRPSRPLVEQPKPRYGEISVRKVVLYPYAKIRVTRVDQRQFEGKVRLTDDGDLQLTQRHNGGEFGVLIPRAQVRKLEVYRVWEVTNEDTKADSQSGAIAGER